MVALVGGPRRYTEMKPAGGLVRSPGVTGLLDTGKGCGGRRRGRLNAPLAYDHNLPGHTRDLSDQPQRTFTPVGAGFWSPELPCPTAVHPTVADQGWCRQHA